MFDLAVGDPKLLHLVVRVRAKRASVGSTGLLTRQPRKTMCYVCAPGLPNHMPRRIGLGHSQHLGFKKFSMDMGLSF